MQSYESDLTKFMREFLENNPQLVEKQKEARATWWDKSLSYHEQERLRKEALGFEPYYDHHTKSNKRWPPAP